MARIEQRTEQRMTPQDARTLLKDWDEDSKFALTEEEKRDFLERGMSEEWKRYEIRGKEDTSHQTKLKQLGYWSAVPGSRLPRFGFDGDSPIIVDEMILMERPVELTNERKRRDDAKAKAVVGEQVKSLELDGKISKEIKGTKVKRSMEIPD